MRPILAFVLICFSLAVAGCSRSAPPPAGKWEGVYDVGETIIAARMEITPKGEIFVSAPNAETVGDVSSEDRAAMRQRLADGLEQSWSSVQPHPLDFDGKTFRKPGGIAPQAEWDATTRQMTLVVYLGKDQGIRIPLHAVKDFSPNPFSNP
jgi:hypothetical protein